MSVYHARPLVDPRRLWTGGVVAAIVVAGVVVACFLIVRGVLDIPVLGVDLSGGVFLPSMLGYAFGGAAATLLLTGLAHLLLITTPRPRFFLGWIIGVLTAIAVIVPFTKSAPFEVQLATAAVNLIVGVTIGVMLSTTAAASAGRNVPPAYPVA
ncbi:hypothetical protein HDA40_001212 [Hamadaea flava]|uniref:DUF6069 family protein n=1 Tax=Hamadaea flava TaxID=1742688 RepID=A0ABV8LQ85_9ACTN|nr:DUF6069 family protein [Hamadaea flava]MCP2322705.1 hypothetical protein [Hamadaea flava]